MRIHQSDDNTDKPYSVYVTLLTHFINLFSIFSWVLYPAAPFTLPIKFTSIIHDVPPSFPVSAVPAHSNLKRALATCPEATASAPLLPWCCILSAVFIVWLREKGCTCARVCPELMGVRTWLCVLITHNPHAVKRQSECQEFEFLDEYTLYIDGIVVFILEKT